MAERDADGKFAGKDKDRKEENFKARERDLDERLVWLDNREKDLEKPARHTGSTKSMCWTAIFIRRPARL